jgi:hypothetical protein
VSVRRLGIPVFVAESLTRQRALLAILYATLERSLEAFEAADNAVDKDFVADLRRIIERTKAEIDALTERIANEA